MNYKRSVVVSLLLLLSSAIQGYGQSLQPKLRELLYSNATLKEWGLADTALLQLFYSGPNEALYWQNPKASGAKTEIQQLIENSAEYGMDKTEYHYNEWALPVKQQQPRTAVDSIKADVIFSDAVLHFLNDLRYGHAPSIDYDGLKYMPDKQALIQLLQQLVSATDRRAFLNGLEPDTKQYATMKKRLFHFMAATNAQAVGEDSIVSKKVDVSNKPLLFKLFLFGVLDTSERVTHTKLVAALKLAQRQMDLLPDGKLNSFTLKALNVSIKERAEAIKSALNTLRWMYRFQNDSLAIINIPSANLFLYGGASLVYESRLVVGKKETPTPTLVSCIQQVILYPYWNVPYSIATKELLPKIKQDRSFLTANNFQVLSMQGVVLNPNTINWKSLNAKNFPYAIRQSTGCDNSLGLIKFDFPNPFSVYLHDTPAKGLFALRKRYFSHGCMRVEDPVALAELLLQGEKATIKKLTEQCLKDQKPTVFKMPKSMPVAVLYNTAWYDANGNVLFYDDVYGK